MWWDGGELLELDVFCDVGAWGFWWRCLVTCLPRKDGCQVSQLEKVSRVEQLIGLLKLDVNGSFR
jgi:hypothetical protein